MQTSFEVKCIFPIFKASKILISCWPSGCKFCYHFLLSMRASLYLFSCWPSPSYRDCRGCKCREERSWRRECKSKTDGWAGRRCACVTFNLSAFFIIFKMRIHSSCSSSARLCAEVESVVFKVHSSIVYYREYIFSKVYISTWYRGRCSRYLSSSLAFPSTSRSETDQCWDTG